MLKHFVLGMVTSLNLHAQVPVMGQYILDVSIYGRSFQDILEINSVSALQSDSSISIIKGYFEVPDSFRSEFEGTLQSNRIKLAFIAEEGDEPFKVKLIGQLSDDGSLTGELLSGGVRFGIFKGERSQHELNN
ncbi:MAG: hypothetical protein KC493_12685 [Bacteriovoracaceae bacterium]|nr:hypothetical protein [Bacteriovoracaceae bacterium]